MEIAVGIVVVLFLAVGFTVFFGAPYVPSRKREICQAFTKLYPLTQHDTLVDLGSGDGVVLRSARERGAVAVGYELSPPLAWISKALARGDTKQVIFNESYWRADFPAQTTVVYAFSDSRDIEKMHDLVERQATKLGKTLHFITYGAKAPHKTPANAMGAYFLYRVAPCGKGKA